jgi:hypothetical protein
MDESCESETICDAGWAESEFRNVDFGDQRLTRRLIRVAEDLSGRPLAPINQASEDWAATKGAYRLFSNEKVEEEELFVVHQERTRQRVSGLEVLLAIQDTTYLNYSDHENCEGLGYIGTENLKGIVLHHTLAVTPEGLPLGLLTQKKTTRIELKRFSPEVRSKLPIEEKESFRWIESLRETVSYTTGAKKVVTICDREGDIFDFFQEAEQLRTHYLVRVLTNRLVLHDKERKSLEEAVASCQPAGLLQVKIPAREGQKGRTATVAVRYTQVSLKNPRRRSFEESFPAYAILVTEVEPPVGIQPLHWLLLTNVEVNSLEDAAERVCWYRARWHIETYHKVLKSGCRVEDCRLEHIDRLTLYLTMMGIIAWRIYWFTHISRTEPNAPATVVLAPTELEALSRLAGRKKKIIVEIKTALHAVREVAKLGGFLARRHDGHPGPTVIWRGWQRLSDATEMWETFKAQTCG